MKSAITYRIFYWVPNTTSGDRIAIGLCLFDKENDRLDTHWIGQRDLTRLRNIFTYSSKNDSKDVLNLLSEDKDNWKSKAYDSEFWSYIEQYWNGIIQVSAEKKIIYNGTAVAFYEKSEALKKQFLPLSEVKKKRSPGRPKTITKYFENEVHRKKLLNKVTLGTKIPEHGKYHLLKSLYFDLAARNDQVIGSTGLDFSLRTKTLTDKAHSFFEGFQNIRKIEEGGKFSIVIHKKGKEFTSQEKLDNRFYDDFRYRCEDLNIQTFHLSELPDYIDDLSNISNLAPFVID